MTPAGGEVEKRLDEATAWELHIAFLKRFGVDVGLAIAVSLISEPMGGRVAVDSYATDGDGVKIPQGNGLLIHSDVYEFTREEP